MKRNQRWVLGVIAGAAGLALAGCFDVEQSVSLKRDLSGTAGFNMTVDLEPMVGFIAGMQHSMSGKPGGPTPDELAAARQEMLASQKNQDPVKTQAEVAAQKAQLAQSLPPGIQLVSAGMEEQGMKVGVRFQVAFDDVRKLAQIKLPEKGGQGQPGGNPFGEPFSKLKVVDEGPTVLVTMDTTNPAAAAQERAGQAGTGGKDAPNPEMAEAIGAAFKSMRFAFRLEAPFEVVETNATRRDGHTLYWEIKAADLTAKLPPTLMARFKK